MSRPISLSTYSVGEYAGFFVEVDAHSGRCRLAPAAARSSQRGPENRSRNTWYASLAFATAALPRSGWPSGRRRSVSVSTRLTKNDATDAMPATSLAAPDPLLEPFEVGLDHLLIPLEGKDQRDVDVEAGGERRR